MSLVNKYPFLARLVASAVSVSNKSAHILRDIKKSGDLNIQEKAANDYVTRADFLSQLNIIKSLENMFPKLKLCGEEGELKDEYNDFVTSLDQSTLDLAANIPDIYENLKEEDCFVWVDPLDGTREYTQGNDVSKEVTILIGISWNGKPIAGIVNQPFYELDSDSQDKYEPIGRCIWGIVGLGAYDSIHGKINVHKQDDEESMKTKIVTTRSHITDIIKRDLAKIPSSSLIHTGGAGYKVLRVIENKADCYIYPSNGTKKWDTCGPEAILRAMGGSLTDIYGNDYSYLKSDDIRVDNCFGIIASIHKPPAFYSAFLSEELKDLVMKNSSKHMK